MFTKIYRVLSALLIAGILLGSATFPTSVRADTTITVTTADDELNSDGDCSLREAIQAANTDSAVDACPAGSGTETINVPAGTYQLTRIGREEDANVTGDLDITDSVTIIGAGAGNTIIQAGITSSSGIDRVLHLSSGITVNITDIKIRYGRCDMYYCNGGGIYNSAYLTVRNSTFFSNTAARGDGILNEGSLAVENSTFSGNIGGGVYNVGTLTVTSSTFSNNNGDSGIYNSGSVIVTNSMFSGNNATLGGGLYNYEKGIAIVRDSTFFGNTAARGGGIENHGTMTVTNSTFSGNDAEWGGGINNDGGGVLTVSNSTFSGNFATRHGGGIFDAASLSVANSTFSGNTAEHGGGIYHYGAMYEDRGGIITPTMIVSNSILANTTSGGSDCYVDDGVVGGAHNLIETDSGGANACGTTSPIHSDPNLGPLADNGGSTLTFALLAGSPAIDAGDDAICAAAPVNNTSQNGVTRPQGAQCDIGSYELPISTLTLKSVGTKDGWILESIETSGVGGTMNVNGQAIALGDDAVDKQYRSILHFNTESLPDNAVITKVTLKVKKKAVVGTDPFTTHQYIKVDIKSGGFSNNPALQLTDFQSAASKNWVGTIKNTPVGGWYSVVLKNTAFPYINLIGVTQFRLYFALDDDNDNIADYIQFFSGNVAVADRPQLIVEYYAP